MNTRKNKKRSITEGERKPEKEQEKKRESLRCRTEEQEPVDERTARGKLSQEVEGT